MRIIFTFCCLLLVSVCSFAQSDCRVKSEDLKPIISRFNPFFTDHRWEDYKKLETASMDKDRLLIISQAGCKRLHTTFLLIISPRAIDNKPAFWLEEGKSLLHSVFFDNPVYSIFKSEFEEAFEEKFLMYGLNNSFNFPVGTRNFVCELKYDPVRGANMRIEMVRFIFEETIQKNPVYPESWMTDGLLPQPKNRVLKNSSRCTLYSDFKQG